MSGIEIYVLLTTYRYYQFQFISQHVTADNGSF